MPEYSQFVPGVGIDALYRQVSSVLARRMTGPFVVRGSLSTKSINDGWLCKDETGEMFGIEDVDFQNHFVAKQTHVIHTSIMNMGNMGVISTTNVVGASNAPAGECYAEHGANRTLYFIPDEDNEEILVDQVFIDGVLTVPDNSGPGRRRSYTFVGVVADHTVAVSFAA